MKSADNKERNYQFKTNINMKTKTSILTLTNVFFILLVSGCLFIACNSTTEPVVMKDSYGGSSFRTIVIDSCEYVYLSNWFAHKGNCKYCKVRSLNNR